MYPKSAFYTAKRDAGSNGFAFAEALHVNGSDMLWASISGRPKNYFS